MWFLRHLLPVPFIAIGAGLVTKARPIADLYARTYGWLGLRRMQRTYESRRGTLVVRAAGVAFVVVALYWTIVGLDFS